MLVTFIGADDTIDEHIRALRGTDREARIAAAKALSKLGPKAEPAIPALVDCLNDPRPESYDVRVGTLCAQALVAIGKPGEAAVIEALDSADVMKFTGACEAVLLLKEPPAEALKPLLAALRDREVEGPPNKRPKQRAWVAARVLVRYGRRAAPATDDLIGMLKSDNFHEQVAACQALAAIGPPAHKAVPRLLDLVENGVTSSRGHAVLTLAAIGPVEGVDIVTPILAATDDFTVTVRGRALMALAELGPHAESALPQIRKLLEDENYNTRTEAAYAAWKISGDPGPSVAILTKLAHDRDHEIDALTVLGKMGTAAENAAPQLLDLLDTPDPDLRFEIVQTLQRIAPRSPRVRHKLARLAESDPDGNVRRAAGQ